MKICFISSALNWQTSYLIPRHWSSYWVMMFPSLFIQLKHKAKLKVTVSLVTYWKVHLAQLVTSNNHTQTFWLEEE